MNTKGLWVHWIGDLVSLVVMVIALAVNWGKIDARLTSVERVQTEQQTQAQNDRKELKADMQREFGTLTDAIRSLDTKLTAILMAAPGARR
jgi:Mg2+/citrate symporter